MNREHPLPSSSNSNAPDPLERENEIFRLKNSELASMLAEVESLNAYLSALNQEKNDLLSMVTHELRSPLSGILTSVTLMREYYDRMSRDDVMRQLHHIENTVRRAAHLITSLLSVDTIESGKLVLNLTYRDVAVLAQTILAHYEQAARNKQMTLVFTGSTGNSFALIDINAASAVIDNLISNAVKYSFPGGRVEVSVAEGEQSVHLTVRDTGPGISSEDKKRMFGKFSKLSARPTGGEESTGLGLYIVHRLIDMMGGTIACDSEEGRGATFTVGFPTTHGIAESSV